MAVEQKTGVDDACSCVATSDGGSSGSMRYRIRE